MTAQSQSTDSFVVTYKNEKYDIGNFINRHPGGSDVFVPYKNKDITSIFEHIGHSNDAKFLLKKRKITEKASFNNDTDSNNDTTLSSSNQSNISSDAEYDSKKKFIVKKLFTEEDKFNAHKILGLLALISYAYRYFYVLPTTGSLGFNHDLLSYVTLFLHMLLSCSSFVFHILKFRIIENPLIIYEEYRLHAIVFTFRGIYVSCFGLFMHLIPKQFQLPSLLISVLLIHLLVDLITYKFGKPGVTAVRINEAPKKESHLLKKATLGYAFYQFLALASHLSLDDDLRNLGFNIVIAIQSSAFLMTLKRKNLIEWWSHAFWYTFALICSMYYLYVIKGCKFFLYVFLVFTGRVYFDLSKYTVWFLYVVALNYGDVVLDVLDTLVIYIK